MSWLRKWFPGLFRKKDAKWDTLTANQKPSTQGDEFRERNNV